MTRDIKSLCCLTKQNNPTIFLHFFINTAKGSVLFKLTMALILFTKSLSMDVSHTCSFGFFLRFFFFVHLFGVENINQNHLNWQMFKML